MSSPRPRRAVAAATAILALTACGAAEASGGGGPGDGPGGPGGGPVAAYEPHPATRLVDRLGQASGGGLPDLTGEEAGNAAAVLRTRGLRARVVAYDEGPVSAQYPEPGAAAPGDGVVLLWTGTPPAPPPPPPPPAPSPPTSPPPPASPAPSPAPAPAPSPSPTGAPAPPAPDPQPTGATAAGGGEGAVPHPPRVNPLRLPASAAGEVLEGAASWYGPGFAGRTTACGGVFDPDALTLATRELRCGTRVQVTGPAGATVEAVATDWGPAEWTGRRFDLSRATFEAIHPLGAGVVRVTVEVLAP